MVKKTSNVTKKQIERNIINAGNYSEAEQQGIIRLYEALVPGDDKRAIDIEMIVTEAFPKFEETIGEKEFAKVKKYFGIEGRKSNTRTIREIEIKSLLPKLRTIENAQYYIVGYKELVKNMSAKLLNAPEGMSDLEKAKIVRMFFIVLSNNESFLEDYSYKTIGGKKKIVFDEARALANNKLIFCPEQMFDVYSMKVMFSDGYYYDLMVIHLKKMYLENQETKLYKRELAEMLEFAELKYDGVSFKSVNKCMPGATFGRIRQLKQRVHQTRGMYPMEMFCNKKMVEKKIDITDLYIIYKSLVVISPWKTEEKMRMQMYRTMSGSRFVDKEQAYYEVFDNFLIADEAEAERWMALFEYVSRYELTMTTKFDGNGGELPKPENYNVGELVGALNYAANMGYIDVSTMVIRDFEVAKKLLALKDAKEIFLKFKRKEIEIENIRALIGIDEDFERNVLHIEKAEVQQIEITEPTEEEKIVEVKEEPEALDVDSLVQAVIKFGVDNDYVDSEANINVDFIENVFIPGNEESIKKFVDEKIKLADFKRKIGFDDEFAEAYFDASKFDVKAAETKLQEIKKSSSNKGKIRNSRLLIALYCYVIKNGVACGPKHKVPKRNKGLKPEILEKLIAA